jgi:hypothetical protein
MKMLWLNTETNEHAFAPEHATYTAAGLIYHYAPNWCLATGFKSTYSSRHGISISGFTGTAVWAVPAPPGDDVVPMRMSLRNDGYGASEKHPRMNNSNGNASSNPDNSSRVYGHGRNAYR